MESVFIQVRSKMDLEAPNEKRSRWKNIDSQDEGMEEVNFKKTGQKPNAWKEK